jgi:hypothetical protein
MVNINSVEGIESLIEKRNRPLKGQIRELQAELIKLKKALTAPVDVEQNKQYHCELFDFNRCEKPCNKQCDNCYWMKNK